MEGIIIIIAVLSTLLLVVVTLIKMQVMDKGLHMSLTQNESRLNSLDSLFREELMRNRMELKQSQQESFENMHKILETQRQVNYQVLDDLKKGEQQLREELTFKMDRITETIQQSLDRIREENSRKLDEMRATVDEKLQSTLEKRLNDSFKLVSERLEQLHKGLGEMQAMSANINDLRRILSNVKTRGIMGEIQLASILENILSPSQYVRNLRTSQGSQEEVEFAIVLPGRNPEQNQVFLPIDSKFPIDLYLQVEEAFQQGDKDALDKARDKYIRAIKDQAKKIAKYISVPTTTNFAIMFLPSEGMYAEAVRNFDVVVSIQKEHGVIITGPSTLTAILNSLQVGFQTLAIERKSQEIQQILKAVKTEFEKFEILLEKAKENLNKAENNINELLGKRSKAITSKLKNIEKLPEHEAQQILGISDEATFSDDQDASENS